VFETSRLAALGERTPLSLRWLRETLTEWPECLHFHCPQDDSRRSHEGVVPPLHWQDTDSKSDINRLRQVREKIFTQTVVANRNLCSSTHPNESRSGGGTRLETGDHIARSPESTGTSCNSAWIVLSNSIPFLSDSTIEGMPKVLMLSGGAWGETSKSNHKMVRAEELGADARSFREMRTGDQVLDLLEDRFRAVGATAFLASGIPLPGRAIEPLLLRFRWAEQRGERQGDVAISAADPILTQSLRMCGPGVIVSPANDIAEQSGLYRAAQAQGADTIICVPVHAFQPFQGVVLGAGKTVSLDRLSLLTLDHLCEEAFRRLLALRAVSQDRPGDLSARERRVVALSSEGKTASDIAKILAISQRTVHAHLQNASDKLRAHNKTQTVVEALRYGQITL
jgi:LuxR family quorum sensing-dependent transcriptional regulator